MNGTEEKIALTSRILKGEIGRADVEKELDRISKEYGEDCFNSYTVKRKPEPWNEEDLKELQVLSASGAASKEFYRYMAEVSETVYSKRARGKKICFYLAAGAVIILIAIIICSFGRANAAVQIEEPEVKNCPPQETVAIGTEAIADMVDTEKGKVQGETKYGKARRSKTENQRNRCKDRQCREKVSGR